MATFTPSLSGVKGRALFSLLFMAPLVQAADTTTAKDGETLTVTADPTTTADATNGYQPLNTSTATLTNMPMLDIPQVVNTVSNKVLGISTPPRWMKRSTTSATWCRPTRWAARRMRLCAAGLARTVTALS